MKPFEMQLQQFLYGKTDTVKLLEQPTSPIEMIYIEGVGSIE